MNKQKFIEVLVQEVQTKMGDNYKVSAQKVTKNNGLELSGITILKNGESMSPNVYVEQSYMDYCNGKPISSIVYEVIEIHNKALRETSFSVVDFMDFEQVKDKIILRVINYEQNKKDLDNAPHVKFLDLAITFRYLAEHKEDGIASSLIHNSEFEAWNVDKADLYNIALENTEREFPAKIESMFNFIISQAPAELRQMLKEEVGLETDEIEKDMYILSNKNGLNGATCILYKNVVARFANENDCDLYILPSSIHEMLLVPVKGQFNADDLSDMVNEANRTAVGLSDYLSDSVYFFDRRTEEFSIIK